MSHDCANERSPVSVACRLAICLASYDDLSSYAARLALDLTLNTLNTLDSFRDST